jgi:hypothetical protein
MRINQIRSVLYTPQWTARAKAELTEHLAETRRRIEEAGLDVSVVDEAIKVTRTL